METAAVVVVGVVVGTPGEAADLVGFEAIEVEAECEVRPGEILVIAEEEEDSEAAEEVELAAVERKCTRKCIVIEFTGFITNVGWVELPMETYLPLMVMLPR